MTTDLRHLRHAATCKCCGARIEAGQPGALHKLGGKWDALCATCAGTLDGRGEERKLLEALSYYNAGAREELDPSDHRLLADYFPSFRKYHRGQIEAGALPAFLGATGERPDYNACPTEDPRGDPRP